MSDCWPTCFQCVAAPDTPIWFPARYVNANLAYSINVACAMAPGDVIGAASVAIAPSGDGEMVPSAISINGSAITILPTGGQPGRVYIYNLIVTMTDGNVYPFVIQQCVSPGLAGYPIPIAPDPGYGTMLVCNLPSPIIMVGPAYITALGTGQSTAAVLVAQTSIINAGSSGAGVVLPPSGSAESSGSQETVINITAYDQIVYPYGSDSIGTGGPGVGLIVSALTGYVTLNLAIGSTVWVVS